MDSNGVAEFVRLLSPQDRAVVARALSAARTSPVEEARERFLPYLRYMWHGFLEGKHHAAIANAFERVAAGSLKRLIITLGPRHGKSESTSIYLPSWFLGRFPQKKIICATHTEKLSLSFGRRVRNLIRDPQYAQVFPGTQIAKDSKAAGRWSTSLGGEYFAVGVGGAVAGRGADLCVIDDPHSEQDVLGGADNHFDKVWEWFNAGPRQRLQPGAAIIIAMTRWSKRDLVGRALEAARQDRMADQWEVLSLPAILPDGKALFPEFWPLQELELLRRNLPVHRWFSNYQQNPVSEETAIVKRHWWKRWTWPRLPKMEFVIQSWDTSFGKYTRGDPSACTLWGVFSPRKQINAPPGAPPFGLMLIDAYEGKLGFPELKAKALELWRLQRPDTLLIEARASGDPLIDELRRMGLPGVARTAPTCAGDKFTRLNAVADLFSSGLVWWSPECPLADRVIEQFAQFPDCDHDDLMDSSVQALQRFREGGYVRLATDIDIDDDDERWHRRAPREAYY